MTCDQNLAEAVYVRLRANIVAKGMNPSVVLPTIGKKNWADDLVCSYGISTIGGYLMPNPIYKDIFDIHDLVLVGFYGISTIAGHLMPNPLYTYMLSI